MYTVSMHGDSIHKKKQTMSIPSLFWEVSDSLSAASMWL